MGVCSCKEEQIKLQECEAKLSHLQDVFENNIQSKVTMINLGLLNIGVEENSNTSATCDCRMGPFSNFLNCSYPCFGDLSTELYLFSG